jgi:hypothetical protein
MLTLLAPVYNKLGFTAKTTDEHLDILLRQRVVSLFYTHGNTVSQMQIIHKHG